MVIEVNLTVIDN